MLSQNHTGSQRHNLTFGYKLDFPRIQIIQYLLLVICVDKFFIQLIAFS